MTSTAGRAFYLRLPRGIVLVTIADSETNAYLAFREWTTKYGCECPTLDNVQEITKDRVHILC